MGAGKTGKKSLRNPKSNTKSLRPKIKRTKKKKKNNSKSSTIGAINNHGNKTSRNSETGDVQPASPSHQLRFFLNQFQSANGVQLSSLELESIKDTCVVDVSQDLSQDGSCLGKHMKAAFGSSWKEALCEGQLLEDKIEPGSPAVLVISTSALRSIELLRGMRSLTRECRAVKLFSKHMKVDEQVSLLKNRVNIASGTPSRIKKLIDIEALGLSRLAVIVLDIYTDVKGYSLLTLPQVRGEFWDLYKNYFHQRLLQGDLRICFYGPIPNGNDFEGKRKGAADE
ncbi:hypothetical protein SLEP1_g45726 [Rubroshorea leprosula]|uniref:Protein CMSS1 n=1 Tax=Rubroshorea leprosula TaxID=152421 RepID=A0AAV5LJZ8_9ROSI|nr:hypothetical protein SLEP1_g45726 [Rubroshorea leprosula]